MKKVAVIYGTRPEVIKLAPVVRAMRRRPGDFELCLVGTGQHRELTRPLAELFGMEPDRDLEIMRPGQTLSDLVAAALAGLDPVLADISPGAVVVQGDTSSVFAAALAAFHRRIPVAHVEAGLRTNDRYSPFPEEINRRLVSCLASVHFAPTERARKNLVAEGFDPGAVHVVGNTVVDAMAICDGMLTGTGPPDGVPAGLEPGSFITMTCHRRENWGEPLEAILRAGAEILERRPEVRLVFPVHPNPEVSGPARRILGSIEGACLIEPVGYLAMLWMLKNAALIWTDSGGIQEEAATFRRRVLVLREKTERPEVIESGFGELVGHDTARIVDRTIHGLDHAADVAAAGHFASTFGDGKAGERIAAVLSGLG